MIFMRQNILLRGLNDYYNSAREIYAQTVNVITYYFKSLSLVLKKKLSINVVDDFRKKFVFARHYGVLYFLRLIKYLTHVKL